MVYKDYKKFLAEVLITEEQLKKRIAELGKQISEDYAVWENSFEGQEYIEK